MASRNQSWPGELLLAVCQIRHPNALRHSPTPINDSERLLFVSSARTPFAALTAAKITSKPVLPMVAILEMLARLAINRVNPEVIINPKAHAVQL